MQPGAERRQRLRALRRGRLAAQLDRALERGERGVVASGLVQVHPEVHVQERRTGPVVVPGELDGAPRELGRARRGAGLAGELGRPGAEPGQVEPGEPGRVRHRGPQRERPLEVRGGLGEAEDRLGLACGFDRGGQRLAVRPAAAQCGASSAGAAAAVRASSSASRACSSSRSPGRIVA